MIGVAPDMDENDTFVAIQAARTAFPSWSSMTASAMREAGCAATVRDWSEVTAEFLQGLLA